MAVIKWTTENVLLFLSYLFVFFIVIYQGPIFSPDTYGYLNAVIYRSSGYPVFSKFFMFVFGQFYDIAIICFQIIFGLYGVHLFLKTSSRIFHLKVTEKTLLFLVLIFPFFSPLLVANNICSEGLSYPLYLILIGFSLQFLLLNRQNSLKYIIISSVLLTLTRSQFLPVPLILAIIYFFKFKKELLAKKHLSKVLIIVLVPIACILMDKTYHKLKDGKFISTPFAYVNACASALYVSDFNDTQYILKSDDKNIFIDCYRFLDKHGWLISTKSQKSNSEKYNHFHNNMSNICNKTLHDRGRAYYRARNLTTVQECIATEKTAKNLFFALTKNNFKKWIILYFNNIVHGFKSIFVLIFVLVIALTSFVKLMKDYSNFYAIQFLISSLILSNSLIIAFASHSIMRYLFYNYALFFLLIVMLIKYFFDGRKA